MADLMQHLLGETRRKIHVNDIRKNPLNFYADLNEEDEDFGVVGLAEDIERLGQKEDIEVYEDRTKEDGKQYTLLSGERRWKAITYNLNNGVGDGLINAIVTKRPENDSDELNRIISGNHQREKNESIRMEEVRIEEENWNALVEAGNKPEGKKRVWIGKRINLSERQVQTYLTRLKNARELVSNGEDEAISGESFTDIAREEDTTLTSADKDYLRQVQENLSNNLERKVKINPKKLTITFYAENMDDIPSLLNNLGFTESGDFQ